MFLECILKLLKVTCQLIAKDGKNFRHGSALAMFGNIPIKFKGVLGHLNGKGQCLAVVGIRIYLVWVTTTD